MAHIALVSLQAAVNQILSQSQNHIARLLFKEIVSIHDHAVFLQSFLESYPEKASTVEDIIREEANKIKEIIEKKMSQENPSDPELKELARRFEKTVGNVVDYFKSNDSVNNVRGPRDSDAGSSSSRPAPTSKSFVVGVDEDLSDSPAVAVSSSSRPALTEKDAVVGFEEDLKVIKERLLGSSSKLQVLPIVGVGGSGKTTLAKIVYNKLTEFEICAWVTISQDYSVGSILLNLLASMKGIPAESEVQREIDMASLIHEYLRKKRYLIVIDDIYSKKAWDDIKMLFPDDNNRSRIILTTRLLDVAAYSDSSRSIHMMRLLDVRHSWNLLKQKVFADDYCCCPAELENIGKEIVKICRGLPLSIVVVAGLLSKIPKTPYVWKQIAANNAQLETLLSLSYDHLPDHLRKCFLYMASFPEDYEIHVSELIKLWVAEGFLKCSNESKSLEEQAEDCLEDLVERSLVLVTSKKSDGKIKRCSLHDIVRDFCVRQTGKEKLLVPVMDYLPSPILRRHFLPQILKDHHNISATWYDLDRKDSMHSSHTRTIICIPQKGHRPVGSIQKYSSLRVLYVLPGNDHWNWVPGQVFDLVYLTYLASNIPTSIVPRTISKLQNLQTLIIYRSKVRLPVEIWRMRQLRHFIAFSFHPLPHPKGATCFLDNLQTLSLATNFVCSQRMVKMIPKVKKLEVCYSKKNFAGYHLNNLARLRQLEKLKLERHRGFSFRLLAKLKLEKLPNPIFPLSLKKLTLSCWGLPWTDMTIIGSLPNLQVLKLRNYACEGEHWETTEGEFGALRHLLIDGSNLETWTTGSSHFPRLECLMLHRCPYLIMIPSEIGDIQTLKLIEVDDWKPSSEEYIEGKQQPSISWRYCLRCNRLPHYAWQPERLLNWAKMIERQQLRAGRYIQVRVKRSR